MPRPGPRSGYLLTGDPEELDASRAGRVELLARLESLHALVAQDPSHKGLVTRFEELARARLAVLDRVVEFHEVGRSEAAAALISDEGKRLMAEARATIGTLMAQEGGELRHRSAEAAEAAEADQRVQNIYIILFVMGLGLVLAAASLSLEVSQAIERAKSAEALEAVNASLEARVREAVEENRQAAQQIFEMQKLETLGSLTGGVAHDFNNLLTPILSALERAQAKLGADRGTQRLVASGIDAAERARLLIARLLAFGRRTPLESRPVEMGALVKGKADLVRRTIGPHITVNLKVPALLPPAQVDPNQLELALLNLAINARDAMPAGGRLTIGLAAQEIGAGHRSGLQPGRYIQLAVIDTGTGMDAETLKRCVEPFFSTKGVGKGTGLGLSMIHGLAAQSGGQLRMSSAQGLGTRAEIWLPESNDPLPEILPEAQGPAIPASGRLATILLADDDEVVRVGIAETTRELGHRVVETASGTEALELLSNGLEPDLLVTDSMMGGMDGLDLAQRAMRELPDMPVAVATDLRPGRTRAAARAPLLKETKASQSRNADGRQTVRP